MTSLVVGVFTDSKKAGELVSKLKNMDYTDKVSVISKQVEGDYIDVKNHQIKDKSFFEQDIATSGAIMGGLIGLFAGVAAVVIPGNILIIGPLATALLGLGGGITVGAFTGLLVDMGIPEETATVYTDRIQAGDTLVAVEVDDKNRNEIEKMMKQYQVVEMEEYKK